MNKRSTGINVGGSSILVIFILLCLTTFATLSMVSAGADLRLTEKAAKAAEEYYAADAEAERILAAIDGVLEQRSLLASSPDAYLADVRIELQVQSAVEGLHVVESGANTTVFYSVPVDDNRELAVALAILPYGSGARYERLAWQVRSAEEWEPAGEGMTLWSGEGDFFLSDDPLPITIEE